MTRTDAITDKIAGFGELREIALAWLLAEKAAAEQERAMLLAKIERLDAELAAIAADAEPDAREVTRRFH
jgi:hypothetical protein